MKTSRAAARFRLAEIRGVTMRGKLHVAGVVMEDGIGVSGTVVEELCYCLCSCLGAVRLCRSNGTQCNKHGVVDCSCIEEEGPHHFLKAGDFGRREKRGSVRWSSELGGSAIVGRRPCMWRVLGSGWGRVLELSEGLGDVAWHGTIASSRLIVPLECHTQVQAPGPVFGDGVHCPKGIDEVLGMLPTDIFHTKVIDNKGKRYRPNVVSVETWCMLRGGVAVCCKMFLQAIIGKDTGLRKSIHALADLNQDVSIVDQ